MKNKLWKILLSTAVIAAAFTAGRGFAQEEPPAGQFLIRATGAAAIPLYSAAGLITTVQPQTEFGYELQPGEYLVIAGGQE